MIKDVVWISGSLVVLYWSARVVKRRFIAGASARYVTWGIRVYGSVFLILGLVVNWVMFSKLFPADGFWAAMVVNTPNLFTIALWGGVLGGRLMEMIYPNALR